MRAFIAGSLVIIAAGVMGGCGSSMGAKTAPPTPTHSDKITDAKTCVMQTGAVNVLQMTMPVDVTCVAKDGSLHFTAPQYEVEVWLVRGAQTIDEAIGQVGPDIADEFKDFKPEHETDLTIAGSPAKQLVGSGHEADDGDPGDADLIVFKAGGRIFVACNHGESLTRAGQQGLLTLVQTAQAP
jgi:hypothetical protein